MVMGWSLVAVNHNNPQLCRLGKELRVMANAHMLNEVAEVLVSPIRDMLGDLVKMLPAIMPEGNE